MQRGKFESISEIGALAAANAAGHRFAEAMRLTKLLEPSLAASENGFRVEPRFREALDLTTH